MSQIRTEAAPLAGRPSLAREIAAGALTVALATAIALAVRTLVVQPYTIPSGSEEPNLYRGDYILVSKWSYGYSRHSVLGSPPLPAGRLFFHPPARGDIVVFKLPGDGHTDYIKRLVGLPGDRVQVRGGRLFINGAALPLRLERPVTAVESQGPAAEPAAMPAALARETGPEGRSWTIQLLAQGGEADNTGVYAVPAGCYFVMGDNRANSADSRFDPGLAPGDPKLGGCGWDSRLDAYVGAAYGVGFVPGDNLVGRARMILLSWDAGVDEWHNRGVSPFKPWTWITALRPARFFRGLI